MAVVENILTARGLVKKYGDLVALRGIDLTAEAGRITGLIGPDGAGKSSFMRILLGLLKRDAGDLELLDSDPGRDRSVVRSRVGYMPEVFSLYTDLSVEENLLFSFRIHRGNPKDYPPKRDRLYRFNRLDGFSGTRAGNLSGGMKQKLALSCALMHDPTLLVLDEPTTGVDPLSRREFWSMLKELREQGIAVLVSTPYMEEALQCDRVYLMNQGLVLDSGAPEELIRKFPGRIIEVVSETLPPQELRRDLHARFSHYPVYLAGRRVHISLPEGTDPTAATAEITGEAYDAVHQVEPDLEDLFLTRVLAGGSQ